MDYEQLRVRLASWEHVGPFRDVEDLWCERQTAAREMGEQVAPLLVEALLRLDEAGDEDGLRSLDLFLSEYEDLFPEALDAALWARLTPAGPPILVENLGRSRSPDALSRLRTTLDLTQASDKLLFSLASALGELGRAEGLEWVEELKRRPGLSPGVQKELHVASQSLSRTSC